MKSDELYAVVCLSVPNQCDPASSSNSEPGERSHFSSEYSGNLVLL